MPGLVQKCGYLKAGKAGGYMRYIATRERVEKLAGNGPATSKQKELIRSLLRDFPDTRELHEHTDYLAAPTAANASAFLSMALDMNAHEVQTRDGYMRYIATRPRAERQGEHGLFGSADSVSLTAALRELDEHRGNVWTFIYSLRREDAERLGYDNAAAWRALLRSRQVEMAEAMKIPPDKLRWYAAFHDEDTHPHIHLMVWSADPKRGYLTKEGVSRLRSVMTNEVFRDELRQLYREKDQSYKDVARAAGEALRDLMAELRDTVCDDPEIGEQLQTLAVSLASVSGKKQYGYLPRRMKEQVDRIVDALGELSPVYECYEAWNVCKDALYGYYRETPRERLPLSRQKEFRAIRNMVVREADLLRQGELTFEDEDMPEEPLKEPQFLPDPDLRAYRRAKGSLYDPQTSREEKAKAVTVLESLAGQGAAEAALLLGKAWRDGLCAPPWEKEAEKWFRMASDLGSDQAQYHLGVLLLEQGRIGEGLEMLLASANRGNAYAMYRLGKETLSGKVLPKDMPWAIPILTDAAERGHMCAQYLLGKLCLQGEDVPLDPDVAAYWLETAAAQGHRYARILLDRQDERTAPSVILAATRLLYHLSRVFRDAIPAEAAGHGLRMDRKRLRELAEQKGYRAAMNYARAEQESGGPTMTAPR